MSNLSIIGFILCLVLILSFLYEGSMLIRVINKKQRNKVTIHLLGTVATLLLTIMTVIVTFNISSTIPNFMIILTCVVGILFFFIGGIESVKVEKKK